MKGQAAIENIFYYIILFIGVAGVIYIIFQYIQDRAFEAQRANLYAVEQYIKTKFISVQRLGPGGYQVLELPNKINGHNYNISLVYNNTAGILNIYINLDNNITYSSQLHFRDVVLNISQVILEGGRSYLLTINITNNGIRMLNIR